MLVVVVLQLHPCKTFLKRQLKYFYRKLHIHLSEIFPPEDVETISIVDSADFAKHDISPEEVVNYIFRLDKEKPLQKNKMLLGLVINKLLLAFKNKPGFLEELVMDSEPSLMSILNTIKGWMRRTNAASTEQLQKNAAAARETTENLKIIMEQFAAAISPIVSVIAGVVGWFTKYSWIIKSLSTLVLSFIAVKVAYNAITAITIIFFKILLECAFL